VAAALSTHRGTISPAPSFAYAYAAERVKAEHLAGQDLSSWRLALDALTPVYGLSEATLAVTFTPPGRGWRARLLDPAALASRGEVVDGSREVVSVGLPLPGLDVAERGEDGKELPERRLGRIFVRGGSVMQGYLGQLDATARTLPDGWLDTATSASCTPASSTFTAGPCWSAPACARTPSRSSRPRRCRGPPPASYAAQIRSPSGS
jgi:acyl-CoA synthetase (AMP-forming)/AMP-acid ligase II